MRWPLGLLTRRGTCAAASRNPGCSTDAGVCVRNGRWDVAVPTPLRSSRKSQGKPQIAAANERPHMSVCEPRGCLGHGHRTQVSEVLPGQVVAPRRRRLH